MIKIAYRKVVIVFVFTLIFFSSYSQESRDPSLLNDVEWGEGVIILADGKELNGLVNYSDKKGVVSFEGGRESKVFVPRQLLGFEFFDQRMEKKRLFYSLECEDGLSENKGPFIFELLKELKTFAVLIKADPVDVKQKDSWLNPGPLGASSTNPAGTSVPARRYTQVTQRETIYLFPADGKVTPLLETRFRISEGKLIDTKKVKGKLVNKDLLIKLTGNHYTDLEAYAKTNKLDLEDKEDLLKVFDYYETIFNP